MQRLILIRHAEAEDRNAGGDFERVLTDKGRHQATRAGGRRAAAGFTPDVAVISPSARTRETWEYAAKAWGAVETREDRALYNADSPAPLMAAAKGQPEETVLIAVHNPAAHALALDLLRRAGAAEANRVERKFPKGAALVVRFDGDTVAFETLLFPKDDPADQ